MRRAGRVAAEILAVLVCLALLGAVAFRAGADYGRIQELRAQETAPKVVLGPRASAARLYPRCPRPVGRAIGQRPAARGQR
jgi:hypothetical protein